MFMSLPPLVDENTPVDATIEVVYERREGALSIKAIRIGPLGDPAPALAKLSEMERAHIAAALALSRGRRAPAARMLGISERNLYRKIRAHNIHA
jgi:DNA-binding NtrC family response regulator